MTKQGSIIYSKILQNAYQIESKIGDFFLNKKSKIKSMIIFFKENLEDRPIKEKYKKDFKRYGKNSENK